MEFKLADQTSLLACSVVSGHLEKELPPRPTPLKDFLGVLESIGKVKTKIMGHGILPNQDGDGISVTCVEKIAVDVPNQAPHSKQFSCENIAGLVDIAEVKKSQYVQLVPCVQCPDVNGMGGGRTKSIALF